LRERILGAFGGPGLSPDPHLPRNTWPAPDEPGDAPALKSAAVLVPLIDHATGMTVLLTRRTETLPAHAGQISFPGGRIEHGDCTPEDTALRETEEEIGVLRSRIELVGRLNAHDTGTGFRVMPVIGLLAPPLTLNPDPSEVAHIFEVPLDFVLDPANHRFETRISHGTERQFPTLPYREHFIWGLTARVLMELAQLLRRP
jgi:8-oxo-dGTP pyrophosphatase MutT (NUDIX family)